MPFHKQQAVAMVVKARDSDDGMRTSSAYLGEIVERDDGMFVAMVGVDRIGPFGTRKAATDALLHERRKTGSGRS
jgi:hypothetical protein